MLFGENNHQKMIHESPLFDLTFLVNTTTEDNKVVCRYDKPIDLLYVMNKVYP